MQLTVIIPFHRNLTQLRASLAAARVAGQALPKGTDLAELIVVADGAVDDPAEVARDCGARVLEVPGPRGPAVARNRGAAIARGDLLVFVDTDVVMSPDALAGFAALFAADPGVDAAFGAYDEAPADPGFISQCKNLAHSYVHQKSRGEAQTFWAGLGAIRAEAFARIGGFDERFARPSVEDIDLGYRLRSAGGRIRLEPAIQGKHLKRWTFRSAVVTDLRDRGVPWSQLLHRYGGLHDDLNITWAQRACVVIAYLLVALLAGALLWPWLLLPAVAALASLWWLDRPYYGFFSEKRGLVYALRWFPFQVLQHLSNGVSFALGTVLALGQHRAGLKLPWSLPAAPWTGSGTPSPQRRPVESR